MRIKQDQTIESPFIGVVVDLHIFVYIIALR